jgi:Ras-related protein Rab-23
LLARALGCRLLRTSVKEDINVNAVFRHLAACCLAELRLQEEEYALSGASNGIPPLTISKQSIQDQIHSRKESTKISLKFTELHLLSY